LIVISDVKCQFTSLWTGVDVKKGYVFFFHFFLFVIYCLPQVNTSCLMLSRMTAVTPLWSRSMMTTSVIHTSFKGMNPSFGFLRPQSINMIQSNQFSTSTIQLGQFAVNPKRRTARLKAKLKAKQKRLRRRKTKGPWK
jgi:hypothetical protein